ncbi:LegC family aminotransferase [Paenibacillus alginolyticus]|uniref:LegC family aminotransferase n=1 Tax=Paenibacillus alginolyticus TaxID=59839 RepID=A0ABT4G8N6_9BACL|nr:LegC family aminotransferase [Paenibacillus alginolyticus]MCY9692551.1 LegC family aminotransferase [Paenibacillus alginolyticus]MEC0143757.1 LegC family aminotransferase [Paenibacillus alginolyticus]
MKNIANDIIAVLEKVAGSTQNGSILLHEPLFRNNEWNYVKECIDSGWVSSVGSYVTKFEQMIAEYTGVSHAIAVVNGTAALHASLEVLGVERGDEVLLPTLTFIATANAVSYCGAVPHFVDSEISTLGMDPHKLKDYLLNHTYMSNGFCYNKKTDRRIKAVVPMHTFGHSVDIEPLLEIADTFNIVLVEDAAESLGSYYKGTHTGSFGKVSILSFNGNKIVTTGGGGAILTNDDGLAKKLKHITTTAKVPHKWEYYHDQLGYNYRLPNINAALGCAQLEVLDEYLDKKRVLAKKYEYEFKAFNGVNFVTEPANSKSNYWLNAIILDENYIEQRNDVLELTNQSGYMTRPCWNLLHTLPMYSECPKMNLDTAEAISRRLINIPSSVILGEDRS